MRVYTISEDYQGIMEMENNLKSLQSFVGGLIEVVSITRELDLICNDEGKINHMTPTAAWIDHNNQLLDVICGNCLICRHDNEGNFTSIADSDIAVIENIMVRCLAI